jgi:hypothetical protein
VAHQAGSDGHEVALFGRQDRGVPIDDVKSSIRTKQEIAGMDVGVTQRGFQRPIPQGLGEPIGGLRKIEDLSPFCFQKHH